MKRPTEAQQASSLATGVGEEGFMKRYPTIVMYLTDDVWEDGKARETSALSFTVKDGMWQLALNDKALKQSLYTSAATMTEALKLLEAVLRDGVPPWRSWKRGK